MKDDEERVCNLIAAVAVLARQEVEGWITHGSAMDRIQRAAVEFEDRQYVLLRDDDRTVLVFTQEEWGAFKDGINKGEFDMEIGLREMLDDERKSNDESAP
jgi:hypothetical protein